MNNNTIQKQPVHCFIAPINYLHLIPDSQTTHFLLAHLLSNEKYCDFYRKKKEQGHFIILDNSAFEFGKPLDVEEYLELTEKSKIIPDIIVAPDYPKQDWTVTVEATFQFQQIFEQRFDVNKTLLMGVPQSVTGDIKGWIDCYKALSNMIWIEYIGMSILGIPNAFQSLTGTTDISYNRIFATIYLINLGIIETDLKHHYLGLGNDIREIQIQKMLGVMDSNDSSSAFWRGIMGGRNENGGCLYDASATGQLKGKLSIPVDFDYPFEYNKDMYIQDNIKFIQDLLALPLI